MLAKIIEETFFLYDATIPISLYYALDVLDVLNVLDMGISHRTINKINKIMFCTSKMQHSFL